MPFLTKNKLGIFREMIDHKSRQKTYQMSQEYPVIHIARKLSKITGVMSKGLRRQLEEAPTRQKWDTLGFNKDNN